MVRISAGIRHAMISPSTLTEAMPVVASVKMMMLWLVGMSAPTRAAWVVTFTA